MRASLLIFLLSFLVSRAHAEKPSDLFSALKTCIAGQKADALESQKKINLAAEYLEKISQQAKTKHEFKNTAQQWIEVSYSSLETDPSTAWGKYLKYSKQAEEVKAFDDRFLYLENLFLAAEMEIFSIESSSGIQPIRESDVKTLLAFSKTHSDYFKEISDQLSPYGVQVSVRSCNRSKK